MESIALLTFDFENLKKLLENFCQQKSHQSKIQVKSKKKKHLDEQSIKITMSGKIFIYVFNHLMALLFSLQTTLFIICPVL